MTEVSYLLSAAAGRTRVSLTYHGVKESYHTYFSRHGLRETTTLVCITLSDSQNAEQETKNEEQISKTMHKELAPCQEAITLTVWWYMQHRNSTGTVVLNHLPWPVEVDSVLPLQTRVSASTVAATEDHPILYTSPSPTAGFLPRVNIMTTWWWIGAKPLPLTEDETVHRYPFSRRSSIIII